MKKGSEKRNWADLGPAGLEITSVKSIAYDTILTNNDGSPGFLIASPDESACLDLAHKLEETILSQSHNPTLVKSPQEITEEDRRNCHIIALGNIGNNSLMAELYHSYYIAADSAYPGKGGHVLQTVVDPWGCGTNVITCGGSNSEGIERSVHAAIEAVSDRSGVKLFERLRDIAIGDDFKDRYGAVSFECTPEHRQWLIGHAYERLEGGAHRGATPTVAHAGLMYNLTGDHRFAEAYRDLFKILYEDAVNDPGTGPWSPWGFDADFQAVPMLQAWDVVEESEVFSDEDRLFITNHLLWYVKYMFDHAKGHKPERTRSPRHNHYTFAALGVLYGAKYFKKYYDLAEVDEWLTLTDDCFQTQAEAFKANEDCNSYQWLTFYHTLKYAFVRPDPAFLTNGKARLCLDLGIATMDNLGYQVPYGDCREYTGTFSEVPYYKAVAWALNDPSYGPVLAAKERVKPEHNIDKLSSVGYGYDADFEDSGQPTGFLDVAALPLDPIYFEHYDGPKQIEYEKAFDKIMFRHSTDPEDDYLLLDGLSNGGHGHRDGNSIVRYTSKGRIWFADADYLKGSQKFHNTVMVFKDGRGAMIPDYAELGDASWLEGFGYSRSTIRGYCGTDWARHILEVRGRYFLVLDEVAAREAGDYDFRCLWRVIGEASLSRKDRLFTVEQDGPRMTIACARGFSGPAEMVLKEEPMIWGNWDSYPHHGQSADIKVLQERASVHLEPGSEYAFFNVFGANGPCPKPVRLAESLVLLDGEQPAVAGTGKAFSAAAERLDTDAQFVCASIEELFLAGVSSISLDGTRLIQTDVPSTLVLDFAGKEPVLHSGGKAQVQASDKDGEKWLADVRDCVTETISLLRSAQKAPSRNEHPCVGIPVGGEKTGKQVWEVSLRDDTPYALCVDETEANGAPAAYVGTVSGSLFRIDEGKIAWEFRAEGRINSIAVADVHGAGKPEIVVGSADHNVYLLDSSGKELWRRELPFYLHEATVEVVTAADFGAAEKAIIAGSNNCHVHALNADGDELWRYEVIHGVNDIAVADMTGTGIDDVLAVTEWRTWHRFDRDGKGLWSVWRVGPEYAPGANVVRAADVNGDGVPEMICGAVDTSVYAFDKDGRRMWEFFTGEEISALQCADLNGDGIPEIVAGSLNGFVYALDGEGAEIWHCKLGEEINSIEVLQEQGKTSIVVGTDGPLVFIIDSKGTIKSHLDTGRPVCGLEASNDTAIYVMSRDGRVGRWGSYGLW